MSAPRRWRALALLLLGACGDDGGATATSSATAITATTATTATASASTAMTGSAATSDGTAGTASGSGASESSGGSGSSGTGGTTGGGGGGGFCQEACSDDGECMVGGVDAGYVCKESRCQPTGKPTECTGDLFCQIVLGGALMFCEAPDACAGGRVCVAVPGSTQGACVLPSDGMGGGCAVNYGPATLPLLGGGEAEVCVVPSGYCDKADPALKVILYCNVKKMCTQDSECDASPGQPICDAGGECVCTMDAHCGGFTNQPHCVGGRCECTSDAECAGLVGADTCVDGLCGCGSALVCPTKTYFDGTDFVCEPF